MFEIGDVTMSIEGPSVAIDCWLEGAGCTLSAVCGRIFSNTQMPDVKVAGLIWSWLARGVRADAGYMACECVMSGWWMLIAMVVAVALLFFVCCYLAVKSWKAKNKEHQPLKFAMKLDRVLLTRFGQSSMWVRSGPRFKSRSLCRGGAAESVVGR